MKCPKCGDIDVIGSHGAHLCRRCGHEFSSQGPDTIVNESNNLQERLDKISRYLGHVNGMHVATSDGSFVEIDRSGEDGYYVTKCDESSKPMMMYLEPSGVWKRKNYALFPSVEKAFDKLNELGILGRGHTDEEYT